ncbi:MAG: hypothetical protein OJJ21_17080 [Ferrovibrio sp.]|uniref:hypothetical protein n=1 Tax=Ferrovibrio sp. TaxID=1917215 RepID=UPI00262D8F79|nr:hypothetical protein [Ferrovibrio sp.]MCW0235315.1 hypothetical protein [Ferrovibrio sp.]
MLRDLRCAGQSWRDERRRLYSADNRATPVIFILSRAYFWFLYCTRTFRHKKYAAFAIDGEVFVSIASV